MKNFHIHFVCNGNIRILCLILFFIIIIMTGCGGSDSQQSGSASGNESSIEADSDAGSKDISTAAIGNSANAAASGEGGYDVPKFRDASFDAGSAEGNDEARVDLSNKDKGYFALKCSSDARLKLMVIKGEDTYVYDITQDEEETFPFSLGNGNYDIKVMKNVGDTKYMELYATSADVSMKDEFDPFLRPSQYANYSKSSKCVAKASELAAGASDANDFITSVYDYVCRSIKYDKQKAANIQPGYIPVPDEIMSAGKGICFDYASLAACMLRSQGIPTKIIFGYVGDSGDLYHAWNMYYTEESGWVAVEFEVSADEWNRLDLTFSANGEDSKFIGDGSNYLDVYQY